MSCLPLHGRVNCKRCYQESRIEFDTTKRTENDWQITFNPLSWGSSDPEVIVLGFSKGPTQAGALATTAHDEIAYKGSRLNVGRILAHVGLIPSGSPDDLRICVNRLIADKSGRFHFASLIRCTVERHDEKSNSWKGSGGGMLDKFVATSFGQRVAKNCSSQFLSELPSKTKLIIMFGLGTRMNYVAEAYRLIQQTRIGEWKKINNVAYTDGKITIVHVEHFASQGTLIPNWLGANNHERARLGQMAQEAVRLALNA